MMTKPKSKDLPLFVTMNGDNAMRRIGIRYYRDAGHYSIGCVLKDGVLLSDSPHATLDGKHLEPCTHATWKENNGHYAPTLSVVKKESSGKQNDFN